MTDALREYLNNIIGENFEPHLDWLLEWLNPKEAAEALDTTEQALNVKRCKGIGPKFVKDGRRVKYTRLDVLEYKIGKNAV